MATFLALLKAPINIINFVVNYIAIKRGSVIYNGFPKIYGRIIVKNNGYLQMGKNLIFRCSSTSNFIGLTKTCSLFIVKGGRLVMGNYVGMSGTTIYCANAITIGNYVNFGGNVSIWDTDFHPIDFEDRRLHIKSKIKTVPVVIGNDVFIGANVLILKGVTIGDRSIVGAGSVVTRCIPEDEIWAGNPACFIKKIVANTNKLIAV